MARRFPMTPQPAEGADHITYSVDYELQQFAGATLVVGETVYLSDDGVEVLASTSGSYDSANAFSFVDADRNEVGGMYARDDSGQNSVGFRALDENADDVDVVLEIVAESTTSASSSISITAQRDGESSDTTITMERGAATSEIDILTALASGRVRIAPKINLLGASLELLDIYITGTYFVLKYNDGGTVRYKYLDLSGTGTTWVHATSEPS